MSDSAPVVPADAPPPTGEGLRRCFICFMDEGEDGASASDWVNPCPCSLQAHQDCMLDWVCNLEREKKELKCPACKERIFVDGPWDPAIALSDEIKRLFGRLSPTLLLGGVSVSSVIAMGAYGLSAVRIFAGREGLAKYLFLWVDGQQYLNAPHLLLAPNIGPALILGSSFPYLANVVFMPIATIYGVVQIARDENFISWPPSPRLAFTALPYLREMYSITYHEFFCDWERKMDRKLLGLADPEAPQNVQLGNEPVGDNAGNQNGGDGGDGGNGGNQNGGNGGNGRRAGGIAGFLDALLNILDPPDVQVELAVEEDLVENAADEGLELAVELQMVEVEEEPIEEEEAQGAEDIDAAAPPPPPIRGPGHGNAEPMVDANPPPEAVQAQPAPAPAGNNPPPNANRGLRATIVDITNAIVSALLLPGISYGMGELLRLVLPRKWTTPTQIGIFRVETGLLQAQWGRSLAGGIMYCVLKDAFRLYTKHRRVVTRPMRKVRNVPKRAENSA